MNKKFTNRFISILNLIICILTILVPFILNYQEKNNATIFSMTVLSLVNDNLIIFGNNNIFIFYLIISIINIISAIQNRKNKKLLFWYIIFAILNFIVIGFRLNLEIFGTVLAILFISLPFIFAIKNIILNIKNKQKNLI